MALLGIGKAFSHRLHFNATSNCTGSYYEDIKFVEVSCYDDAGVLAAREESFYKAPLVESCNSTMVDVANIDLQLAGTLDVSAQANLTEVQACSYFEVGHGYQFTIFGEGIGMKVNSSMIGSDVDQYYISLNQTDLLDWDWTTLQTLISDFSSSYCVGSTPGSSGGDNSGDNSTTNVTANATFDLASIWSNLSLPWSDWNVSAQEAGMDFSSWNKTTWKTWLSNYVDYYNTLGQYNATVNSSFSFTNLTFEGNIWFSTYNLPVITISTILKNIQDNFTVVDDTEAWFTQFFGPEGFVTLNITSSENATVSVSTDQQDQSQTATESGSSNTTTSFVMNDEFKAIMEWITIQARLEVTRNCASCQTANVTDVSAPVQGLTRFGPTFGGQ